MDTPMVKSTVMVMEELTMEVMFNFNDKHPFTPPHPPVEEKGRRAIACAKLVILAASVKSR
jgi:hypothetical protein